MNQELKESSNDITRQTLDSEDRPQVVEVSADIINSDKIDFIENMLEDNSFLRKAKPKKTDSKQASPNPNGYATFPIGKIAEPPFDMAVWSTLDQISTRLGQCFRIYSNNTVGLGWEIGAAFELNADVIEIVKPKYLAEKAVLHELLFRPNEIQPLDDLFKNLMHDKKNTGNAYLEVVRSANGKITKLYQAKSPSIRVLKDRSGYVQVKGDEIVYFKNFGDKRQMDYRTGEFKSKVAITKRATELIQFKEYTASDDYYGIPVWHSAVTAILGNRSAAERNLNFFNNDAVPRMAVLVSGGKLTPESLSTVQTFFSKGKGVENAHRCMILQIDTEKASTFDQTSAKPSISLEPLTVGETDDASFQAYRVANDEEIREAFGIARTFFSTEDVNKASAYTTKAITNEQEFGPAAANIEHIFYHTVIMDMFSREEDVRAKKENFETMISKAKKLCGDSKSSQIEALHSEGLFCFGGSKNITKEKVIDFVEATKLYKLKTITHSDITGDEENEILIFQSKPLVMLKFKRPQVIDDEALSEIHETYLETGVLVPNEVRDILGRPQYSEDLGFGNIPLPVFNKNGNSVETNQNSNTIEDDSNNNEDERHLDDGQM